MQTPKVLFEVLPVVPPRHPVHPRGRARANRPIRRLKTVDGVGHERVNRASLSFRATRRTRSRSLDTLRPALRPGRVSLVAFPLPGPLSSTASAAASTALFGGFAGTTGPSDFRRSCITGLRPRPSPHGPPRPSRRAIVGPPGSRAWRDHVRAQVPATARGPSTARENAANDVAFRFVSRRRHPGTLISRLNSPARPHPCQRFACALTDANT
jgi:hypothetical protein